MSTSTSSTSPANAREGAAAAAAAAAAAGKRGLAREELTMESTVRLKSGYEMPVLGFGVSVLRVVQKHCT